MPTLPACSSCTYLISKQRDRRHVFNQYHCLATHTALLNAIDFQLRLVILKLLATEFTGQRKTLIGLPEIGFCCFRNMRLEEKLYAGRARRHPRNPTPATDGPLELN